MEKTFLEQILGSPFGSFGFVFAFIFGGFSFVIWVTFKVAKIHGLHNAFNETIRGVKEGMKTDISYVKDDIKGIQRDLSYLVGSIEVLKNHGYRQSPVEAHSPLSPNEIGEQIIKELDLNDIIARNSDKIMSYLNANIGSKNPYDIQQYCIETASVDLGQFFSESDVNIVKKYAFNHGRILFYYGSLIGVLIRDLYFQRNNIDLDEVDKCDPNR